MLSKVNCDNIFDVIICNVFEHIPDHKKAMHEIYRILKPGEWAMLQVPVLGELTFEEPAAGFSVKVDDFVKKLGDKTVKYMRPPESEDIYFCNISVQNNSTLIDVFQTFYFYEIANIRD